MDTFTQSSIDADVFAQMKSFQNSIAIQSDHPWKDAEFADNHDYLDLRVWRALTPENTDGQLSRFELTYDVNERTMYISFNLGDEGNLNTPETLGTITSEYQNAIAAAKTLINNCHQLNIPIQGSGIIEVYKADLHADIQSAIADSVPDRVDIELAEPQMAGADAVDVPSSDSTTHYRALSLSRVRDGEIIATDTLLFPADNMTEAVTVSGFMSDTVRQDEILVPEGFTPEDDEDDLLATAPAHSVPSIS
ncbi:hypothetical protein [Marinobacterium sp. BA1]|uniref:hypothetical protein n=1 Tax=Marinobacterium sp. BA1 TaxID=3138931 RepID=UPI0032E6B8FD